MEHFKTLDVFADMPACTVIIIVYRTFFWQSWRCKHTSQAPYPTLERKIWSHLCDTTSMALLPCNS